MWRAPCLRRSPLSSAASRGAAYRNLRELRLRNPSPQRCSIHDDFSNAVARRKVRYFAISNASRCGSVGVELRNNAALRAGIERSRRDLAILHLSGAPSTASFYFTIYAFDLPRPGSALKDSRTLPLVEGKTPLVGFEVPEEEAASEFRVG